MRGFSARPSAAVGSGGRAVSVGVTVTGDGEGVSVGGVTVITGTEQLIRNVNTSKMDANLRFI